ncbi:M42 family metallopeptidase [Shouchella clausii]|uniref:M42 family metallopeptidase n=1 Tax=Shouchella clausii TaxID=79880 RepID=UPI0026F45B9E|nr:M42 family metallopeptidase [Shouchella clausii]MDO7281845.1 M42 family metallopeptidase [Shouchella clausii]MDO7301940.1 M42 family metallopeptidase [Shouchella clausii]
MNEKTKALFQTLTELPGPSGFEHEVRRFLKSELQKHTDEIVQDKLGSVFGVLRGDASGPKVMVCGHMDEVGFMVTSITDNGLIKFQTLGGWWSQVLLAQRVKIVTDQGPIIGVVGSTPPHLLKDSQRKKPMPITEMYIDVGADDKEDCFALGIKPGQPIVPECPFTPMANEKKILAKAWDNRYGVGLSIELLEAIKGKALPNTVYSGATVQEEVGTRGAQTASNMIQPDVSYVLDASPANDATGGKDAFGHLGKGALLRIFDRTMITHKGMRDFVLDTAESLNIPYQYFVAAGGTDGGRIHTSGNGVPTAVIGVCARYIHTSGSILHVDDYAAAKELLTKLVLATDKTTYESLISFE